MLSRSKVAISWPTIWPSSLKPIDKLRSLFSPGLRAVRNSIQPFLLIQALAACLVILYFVWPGFRAEADVLQQIKTRGGLLFAGGATAFAGVALPELARGLTRRPLTPAGQLAFQVGFFAILGITVDLLYVGLAHLFGSGTSLGVIVEKVVVDQFVYSTLFSAPYSVIAFSFQAHRFHLGKTVAALKAGEFSGRYFPLLMMSWCFWVPVVCTLYFLPSNLQFILFLCTNGAWSLLLIFITSEKSAILPDSKDEANPK